MESGAKRTTSGRPKRSIRPQRAAELVAADIRARILVGELDEGLPTEQLLLEEFSVSRPTLREALRILETEGLIRTRRGKQGGAVVSRPTVDTAAYHLGLVLQGVGVNLDDLAAARHMLEPLCVSLAARRPDREQVAGRLGELNDESEDLIEDGAAFTSSLLRFHEQLINDCGNSTLQILVGTVERVWQSQEEAWAVAASERGDYPDEEERRHAIASHRRIAERIGDGDVDGAARAARNHLAASMRFVCGPFADSGGENGSAAPELSRVVDANFLRR
jgi:GntR family transcriptional regulator, transcriptional repressor for pyruvate dehydrogenase complex